MHVLVKRGVGICIANLKVYIEGGLALDPPPLNSLWMDLDRENLL